MLPLMVGGRLTVVLAYRDGSEALFFSLVLTVLACLAWRMADPAEGFLRDVAASTFTAVYVPFLAGFAALLAMPDDGPRRVTAFVAVVVVQRRRRLRGGCAVRQAPDGADRVAEEVLGGLRRLAVACAVGGTLLFWGCSTSSRCSARCTGWPAC
jgi:phosphatidate cytidylyltransferase